MIEIELKRLLDSFRRLDSESECLEFKEAKTSYDFNKLGKYFSALSNESNLKGKDNAWLIFGIKDNPVPRIIVGSSYRANRAYLDSLKLEVANKTTNRITFTEIYELEYPEGRVVMFEIPSASRGIPTAWDGHYYGRDGESIGPLNIVELESIRRQTTIVDWSAQVVNSATITDLEPSAIQKARKEYVKKNPRRIAEINDWDDITFLNKAKVNIQGKITNTALLLLGKEESVHFLNPVVAKISWILKDKNNIELDYEHFGPPFILNTTGLFNKIRNLTYRYLDDSSLFPTEIKTYEPYVIREALHNCIAHQDYNLQGKITIVEKPDELIFTNLGSFLPGNIKTVIEQNAPQEYYRNTFLADAMVNLNMIDTIGSGIKRMFQEQRNRFFPMPDYNLCDPNKVEVRILGRIWDENYTKLLMSKTDLDLSTVVLLDRVQKSYPLEDDEINLLRKYGLIEGRKPNFYIAAGLAKITNKKTGYIKNKAFDNEYYRDMIVKYIAKFNSASRKDIEDLIVDKLPEILSDKQKKDRVKNLLQYLKAKNKISFTAENKWIIKT